VRGWLGLVGKRGPFRWARGASWCFAGGARERESGGPGGHMGRRAATRKKETRRGNPARSHARARRPRPDKRKIISRHPERMKYPAFFNARGTPQLGTGQTRTSRFFSRRRQLCSSKVQTGPVTDRGGRVHSSPCSLNVSTN
jgi:hypothetical protein